MSTKPRYFFLFSDCLLISKRTGQAKFLLRLWIYLKSGVQLYSMPESPNYEFRLLVPVQGSVKEAKKRRLIIYAKSEEQKEQWVMDLAHLLWACTGKKGPDPSKGDRTKAISVGLDAQDRSEEEEEDRKRGYVKKDKPAAGGGGGGGGASGVSKKSAEEKAKKEADKEAERLRREKEDAKEYSSDEEDNAVDEASGASLIDLDSISDTSTDTRGTDASGQGIPKGVQLSGAGSGSGSGSGSGGVNSYPQPVAGMPWPQGYPYPPGTVIDPATGFPIFPGWPGPINPATGQLVVAGHTGYGSPVTAGMTGAGVTGVGGAGGATGIDWSNPQDPNLSLLGVTQDVSAAVRDLVASQKKNEEEFKKPGVDMDDIASKELREAAETIEAITKQLMARPRKAEDKPADAEITMDDVSDAILNATQAIAKAAGALLKAATTAQAERVKLGQTGAGSGAYNVDPLWSEGLISASHYVVATTQNLVTTADSAINGQAKEETLVASARAVSAATTQLVTAQRAKSVSGSSNTQNLEDCAKGINKATLQLVQISVQLTSTQMQDQQKKPNVTLPTKYSLTEAQRMKLEKQAKILELEKQAELARKELEDMNKANYNKK